MRRRHTFLAVLVCGTVLHAQTTPPADAPYLTPDGAVRITGTDTMRWMLDHTTPLFVAQHPGFRFALDLKPGYIAMPQLVEHITAFTPMAREVTPVELAAYRAVTGADPIMIRVAHGTVSSQTRTGELAVYVNARNPIASLTFEQLARMFSEGTPGGDWTTWGQAGLTGDWAARPIHTVGTPEDAGFGSWMVEHIQSGRPFRSNYRQLLSSGEILKVVAEDPSAIGVCAIDFLGPGLRMVPVARTAAGPFSLGSAEDVVAGRYALDRFVYLFLHPRVDHTLEPWVRDYALLMLSPAVQDTIAQEKDGFLPLNPEAAAAERKKLQ